jgi:N-acetylglucosaminyldiphosphoundecaprenol N-acetyl-beta-D-mannosaminyltransferase
MPISQIVKQNGNNQLTKVDLLGCQVNRGSYQEILDAIMEQGSSNRSSYVCFANVHMLYEAGQNDHFKEVVNQADLVCPDGMPLSVLMRMQYNIKQQRACGMDIFPDVLSEASKRGLSVFFYGSTPDLLDQLCDKAQQTYPDLTLAGAYSPPFRQLTPGEDAEVVKMINQSGANFVFVSLGCPKQEQWMNEHRGSISACMLGLGQAFRTFTGVEKRLPRWARNLSLEWLYRFYLEPRRLWKRYLTGNSWFLFEAGRVMLSGKKS